MPKKHQPEISNDQLSMFTRHTPIDPTNHAAQGQEGMYIFGAKGQPSVTQEQIEASLAMMREDRPQWLRDVMRAVYGEAE